MESILDYGAGDEQRPEIPVLGVFCVRAFFVSGKKEVFKTKGKRIIETGSLLGKEEGEGEL